MVFGMVWKTLGENDVRGGVKAGWHGGDWCGGEW